MPRGFLFLLCSIVVLGQVPPREQFDLAIQSYRDARASGNFDQARARREEARSLLAQTPLDSPLLPSRVQTVAQLYQSSGWRAQARAVVEDELSRANSLVESHPSRIQLLNILADFWQQDGNLLKALSYREKAVTAVEATPPGASPYVAQGLLSANGTRGIAVPGRLGAVFDPKRSVPFRRGANNGFLYQQLEDLYRQLGRPEDAAKTTAKMRALIQDDLGALANSFDRE